MKLSGTCQIEVSADTSLKLDKAALRKLTNTLTEEFSNVLDDLLYREFGIENGEMHSVLVDELTSDDE